MCVCGYTFGKSENNQTKKQRTKRNNKKKKHEIFPTVF